MTWSTSGKAERLSWNYCPGQRPEMFKAQGIAGQRPGYFFRSKLRVFLPEVNSAVNSVLSLYFAGSPPRLLRGRCRFRICRTCRSAWPSGSRRDACRPSGQTSPGCDRTVEDGAAAAASLVLGRDEANRAGFHCLAVIGDGALHLDLPRAGAARKYAN